MPSSASSGRLPITRPASGSRSASALSRPAPFGHSIARPTTASAAGTKVTPTRTPTTAVIAIPGPKARRKPRSATSSERLAPAMIRPAVRITGTSAAALAVAAGRASSPPSSSARKRETKKIT